MLAAGKANFREVIEKAADGVLVVRPEGTIAYANSAAATLLARSREQLLGTMFGQPVLPGETTELDLRPESPGAPLRVAEMRVSQVEWEEGFAYLATLRDITERKRASQALRFLADAGELLAGSLDRDTIVAALGRLAVGHLADWCLIDLVEEGGCLRRLVVESGPLPQGKELNGLFPVVSGDVPGPARVLQHRWLEVFAAPSEADLAALALGLERVKVFRRLGCRAALVVPMLARGRGIGTITFVAATPDRVYGQHEQALGQDLADRAALALDNARLYDVSRDALRKRDEFLAMLAHELRNPLGPILHAAELLRLAGGLGQQAEPLRATIERQGRHLGRLLDDLLDLSRVTHGKIDLRLQPILLTAVIADAVQVSRNLLEARGHRLEVVQEDDALVVEGDATRLAQSIGNLLINAARYTEPHGQISLRVRRVDEAGDWAVVSVTDTGRGIPPEKLDLVFEPFQQLNSTLDRREGGLGLGLTLVRRLVEMHQGRVTAFSEGVGKGSTFSVWLPLSANQPVVQETATPPVVRQRVLVVDDSTDGRTMFAQLLRLWGLDVDEAEDGLFALEKMRQRLPEVALVDIGLPGLDGCSVARAVRNMPGGNRVVLVAVTGYGMPEDRARVAEAGFDVHLVKPVDIPALLALLPPHLARKGMAPHAETV